MTLGIAVREIARPDPAAVETLATHTASVSFAGRIAALLLSALGFLALALAAVGLFGLLAYSVAARRKELGVRLARQPGVPTRCQPWRASGCRPGVPLAQSRCPRPGL